MDSFISACRTSSTFVFLARPIKSRIYGVVIAFLSLMLNSAINKYMHRAFNLSLIIYNQVIWRNSLNR